MSSLVCFFSASGVTKSVAKKLAEAANAELFEIQPKEKYTEKDLKWTNPLARCNREKLSNKSIELSALPQNFEKYDTIFLGFPIWYYYAPNVVLSFIKKVDFGGKNVIIFATSGGTDVQKTAQKLKDVFPQSANILGSKLIGSGESVEELKKFVSSICND